MCSDAKVADCKLQKKTLVSTAITETGKEVGDISQISHIYFLNYTNYFDDTRGRFMENFILSSIQNQKILSHYFS